MEFPATTLEGGVGWENRRVAEGGLRGTKGTHPLPYAFRVEVERWRDPDGSELPHQPRCWGCSPQFPWFSYPMQEEVYREVVDKTETQSRKMWMREREGRGGETS